MGATCVSVSGEFLTKKMAIFIYRKSSTIRGHPISTSEIFLTGKEAVIKIILLGNNTSKGLIIPYMVSGIHWPVESFLPGERSELKIDYILGKSTQRF